MESRTETRNLQQEDTSGYERRGGVASTSGQDYEVALCCLFFLRALRTTSDFFLACNHNRTGKFDDVVLLYRLEGERDHEYSAILLQGKHKAKVTEEALTNKSPFRLNEYLESFKKIRNFWEQTILVNQRQITVKDVILVLYTNTGCVVGDAACDVTDFPELQRLQDILNTKGRILRISESQRIGLPQGQETSDFLQLLLLCTQQMSVKTADRFLENELCQMLSLTSPDFASKLTFELKQVVKAWWCEEGRSRYLTADSEEWSTVLQMQVSRLNSDTSNIDRKVNLGFTVAALKEFDVVRHRIKMTWISVTNSHQASVVKLRLFRTQVKSLVLDAEYVDDHWAEVEALWGKSVCYTLALDLTTYTQREKSQLLQRLQMAAQTDAGRHLIVVATEQPAHGGWNVVTPLATWSALDSQTQERLLSVKVQLQCNAVVLLRDIVGFSESDVMTDEVIISLSVTKSVIRLGDSIPPQLDYYVPRCLQRISSKKIEFQTLKNYNTFMFSSTYYNNIFFPGISATFGKKFKTLWPSDLKMTDDIEGLILLRGTSSHSEIRDLCCKFRVQGLMGEIGHQVLQGEVTQFTPFTWICKDANVVIEGLPGVGKSAYVTTMCSIIKEQFPEAWVLRVDLARNSKYLKRADFTSTSDVIWFLINGLSKDLRILERYLLEHALTVTGNVFLFLDGFDEICPDFTARCCELLKGIVHGVKYRQLVVTTRPVTTKYVQEALETKPFNLPVFSLEEQTLFLKKFSVARHKIIDEGEITGLCLSAGPIIEIPLLCKIAAEVLLNRDDQSLLKYKNPWRQILLYQLFVEKNVKDRLAEKSGFEVTMPGVKKLLESNKKQHLLNLQGLAVRKLMPMRVLSNLYDSTEVPEEKFGLVVDTGESVDFEHRTFAEYFLGCWLCDHWHQCPQQLLRDILIQDSFQFVAATLSWLLFRDLPLYVAVAQGNEVAVRALMSPGTRDRGGRSVLHVAAMTTDYSRGVWELLVASGEGLDVEDTLLATKAVKYAEVARNWKFIELMEEKGATLADLNFIRNRDAAKEVLINAIEKDMENLVKYILGLHQELLSHALDDRNNSLLHVAATNNSTSVMKMLIEIDHDVNVKNTKRTTPLHEASKRGHVEAVRLLIEKVADAKIKDMYGYTAMMLAAREGHLAIVEELLENVNDINKKNNYGETALSLASKNGHLHVVKLIIQRMNQLNITKYREKAFALAVIEGHLEIVKYLMEEGTDPNVRTIDSDTALMAAIIEDHQEVVEELLEKGADPKLENIYGQTALIFAASKGRMEIVKEMLEKGADPNKEDDFTETALMAAARAGHLDVVKHLISKGADVNAKTVNDETALILAVREGHVEIVQELLENVADANVENTCRETALTLAARQGNIEIAEMLIEKGAEINLKKLSSSEVLALGARYSPAEVFINLYEDEYYRSTDSEDGNTQESENEVVSFSPIPETGENRLEMDWIFINEDHSLQYICTCEYTPLMEAARKGHLEMVRKLIEHGADPNIDNADGNTALTLAADQGHEEVVKEILQNGPNPNVHRSRVHTPLKLHAYGGHQEDVDLQIQNNADANGDTA